MNQRLSMRLYLGIFSMIAGMLIVLFYYFANRMVTAENSAKAMTAQMTSQAVLDKIDGNFYERYGDVQAFAYNRLAVDALTKQASTADVEDFMNRMIQYYGVYDLMMLCDSDGKVIAINTQNRLGNPITSQKLVGATIASMSWFSACMSDSLQGAWHSDFTSDLFTAQIYKSSGQGISFACPVKNSHDQIIGAWYTFVNWQVTAEKIRQEAETNLQKADIHARVVLTNAKGELLQTNDKTLFYKNKPELFYQTDENEVIQKILPLKKDKLLSQQAKSKGAYSFKGNGWKAVTLVSRTSVTWDTFFSGEMLWVVLIIACINTLMVAVAYSFIIRSFQQLGYITHLREIIEKIARGISIQIPESLITKDEIGQIGQAVNQLIHALQEKTRFSNEIANGNLGAVIANVQPEDMLGNSLLHMRDQLKREETLHKVNEWKTKGLTELTTLLRDNTDLEKFSNTILAYLIHYLRANQGAFFITNTQGDEVRLEMAACYAYNRRKFMEEPFFVQPGQSLIGQAYQEKEYIYLKEVPPDYVRITSGLGETTPRTLLVVPLKSSHSIEGVLEIASLYPIKPHEIEFVKAMSENIAAVLHDRKINAQTVQLLEDSQEKAEEMRAQEEEMRQNMEEMMSIQEELQRKEHEMSNLISGISTSFAIIEFDLNGTVLSANDNFLSLMGYASNEVIGKHHRIFLDADYADSLEYYTFWNNIRSGEPQTMRFKHLTKQKEEVWLYASYAPLKDSMGNIYKIVELASDITKEYLLELQNQERMSIIECYETEMKETFEELQKRTEQIEAYEEEMKHVFKDLQEYTLKIAELEYKVQAGNSLFN